MDIDAQQYIIQQVVNLFDPVFSLKNFGGSFSLHYRKSYIQDDGLIMLCVQKNMNGAWLDFSKTPLTVFQEQYQPLKEWRGTI